MLSPQQFSASNRLGFHYFPDSLHYRVCDLQEWLPELSALGAAWLVLEAPLERAIPEFFLRGLLAAGIEPILHFRPPLDYSGSLSSDVEALRLLFKQYQRWGARYAILYDRPNSRRAWKSMAWAQADLVERFLDFYLPLAVAAQEEGLSPVFPPLEPGGDYWDLAFLRAALAGILRRRQSTLVESMVLSAYAWAGTRPLDWGAGGPERWPANRPYLTPPGSQDQVGFRIFDWYLPVARAETGQDHSILLLGAGSDPAGQSDPPASTAARNLAIALLLAATDKAGLPTEPGLLESIPAEVLACNFWLLGASGGSSAADNAWYREDGSQSPSVAALKQWGKQESKRSIENNEARAYLYTVEGIAKSLHVSGELQSFNSECSERTIWPITHYVLLPRYAWGAADWDLERIQPLLQAGHATLGFSAAEATLAQRVTVVGNSQVIPDSVLEGLRAAGCQVDRLTPDAAPVSP